MLRYIPALATAAVLTGVLLPSALKAEDELNIPGDCPATLADSAAGLAVLWEDGATSTIKRQEDGVSLEVTRTDDGMAEVEYVAALHGYVTQIIGTSAPDSAAPDAVGRYSYTPDQTAGLQPGESREVTAVFHDSLGKETDRLRFSAGAMGILAIGPCSYDSYPVTITYLDLAPVEVDVFDYVPALGTAFFRGAFYDDGEEIFAVRPVQVTIRN